MSEKKNKGEKIRKQKIHKSIPSLTFEDAIELAEAIQKYAAGQKIRRVTLFDQLKKSPESSQSRTLVTSSSKYGLTKGSYQAEYIELTPEGKLATDPEKSSADRRRAQFTLAIENIPPFKALYDEFSNKKMPSQAVFRDFLKDHNLSPSSEKECIDIFILNAKFLGLLKTIAGAERFLTIDHAIEEIGKGEIQVSKKISQEEISEKIASERKELEKTNWNKTCFYITPIGEEGSEERKHSDLFLSSIVEPALDEFDLNVIRADKIGQAGMITAQVIEYITKSKLSIVDLSFANPNVFYELALRHACRLPVVQLIRKNDKIPFDIEQFRTIQIDTTDIYTLVPKLETYRSEIANQIRKALSSPKDISNPISTFCPTLKVEIV